MRLMNQLAITAENISKEENVSPKLIPTMSQDVDEKLKLAHKVIDTVDRANRKFRVTLLQYILDKPESSYAPVRSFARKLKDGKYQQNVFLWIIHLKNLSIYLT